MDNYYAKPGKNREGGTCTAMMLPGSLIVAAVNVASNIVISLSRVSALLIRVVMNGFFTLILNKPLLKWK